jgi:hypothetical protein
MSQLVPEQDKVTIDVSTACYDEIRRKLVAAGTGGTIVERGAGIGKVIDMGGVVIRTGYAARHATVEDYGNDRRRG